MGTALAKGFSWPLYRGKRRGTGGMPQRAFPTKIGNRPEEDEDQRKRCLFAFWMTTPTFATQVQRCAGRHLPYSDHRDSR